MRLYKSIAIIWMLALFGCNETQIAQITPSDNTGNNPGDNTGNEPGDNTGNNPGDNTGNEPGENTGEQTDQPSDKSVCGDGIVQDDEICDTKLDVSQTCAEYDESKTWAEGKPACAADCKSIEAGTCREIVCGDGIVDSSEACDTAVPLECSDYDDTKVWTEGTPVCAGCKSIEAGSCRETVCGDGIVDSSEACDTAVPLECSDYDSSQLMTGNAECASDCTEIRAGSCKAVRSLTAMNWNVLFEYEAWGGSEVLPRAQILHNILATYETRPDFIAMVEASPHWHYPEVNALLDNLGYAWAEPTVPDENDEGSYMTQIIYRKDRFEVVETPFVTLYPYTDQTDTRHKCVSFAAVLREIGTDVTFIAMSTHWEPNTELVNSVQSCTYKQNYAGPAIMREQNRVKGVAQTVTLIESLRNKYPDAHIFYGGDFNTIDFDLIFESPQLSSILGTDTPSLVSTANSFYANPSAETCGPVLPEGFIGSFAEFAAKSGLISARNQAIADGTAINDVSSINSVFADGQDFGSLGALITPLLADFKIIIDYAFYSPGLTLTSYEVMEGDDYVKVSDHYPIKTTYTYIVE